MKSTVSPDRYVVEVQYGYAKCVIQLLIKRGAQDVVNAGMGYVYMTGTPELIGQARAWRGVRSIMPVRDAELPLLAECARASMAVFVPGDLVKVIVGGTAVVGRVKTLTSEKATVVFAFLGRPIEQQLLTADLQEVVLPEVWQ